MKLWMVSLLVVLIGCSKQREVKRSEQSLNQVSKLIADLKAQNSKEQNEKTTEEYDDHDHHYCMVRSHAKAQRIELLEKKLNAKIKAQSLVAKNLQKIEIEKALQGHTDLYDFKGKYKVLVIPVQFNDVKFDDPKFFKSTKANDYLFGKDASSLTQYYRHASLGQLDVTGVLSPIVTVDKKLADYGEALPGGISDKNARGLVVDSLLKLRDKYLDPQWWNQFDQWDMGDFDNDEIYHEADGFVDAIVLIYAGKSQSSCQRAFDPDNKDPGSSEVPPGPRQDATVECFNRLWPHRWAIALSSNDVNYQEKGPLVEGIQRSSLGGLKIHDNLFARDYNMQSEYSDRSTFIHEFGHSLGLPDVYSRGKANSTGYWDVMSSNAGDHPQEMSSFNKLSLGWIMPKVITQGEDQKIQLGHYNFIPKNQRESKEYNGPNLIEEDGQETSILATHDDQHIYRSAAIMTDPEEILLDIAKTEEKHGQFQAYTDRFDNQIKTMKFSFDVPIENNPRLSFETIYHIETETNLHTDDEDIKVMVDYDIGKVLINGKTVEELRLISGDEDYNGLAEMNPDCDQPRFLELRLKKIKKTINTEEEIEFGTQLSICSQPLWVEKSYDLSAYKGQKVDVEIQYITDGGYTEFGIVIDNLKVADQKIDFEDAQNFGEFTLLRKGQQKKFYHQFYLMEYRDPHTAYGDDNYNMDRNIRAGTQSFFLEEGETLKERFRMLEYDYAPGVVLWYFNSKYDRRTNDPQGDEGNGYLLVVSPQVDELTLPGPFSLGHLFDEQGKYLEESDDFKFIRDAQREEFICFAYTKYATYQQGKEPECEKKDKNLLQSLKFNDKKMMYRRERFNEILPFERLKYYGVGKPYRNTATIRTGRNTFRPQGDDFHPLRAYKIDGKKMVEDVVMSKQLATSKAVSKFDDQNFSFPENKRFHGDSAKVLPKGLSFKIERPSQETLEKFQPDLSVDENYHYLRRPLVNIDIQWK